MKMERWGTVLPQLIGLDSGGLESQGSAEEISFPFVVRTAI